ncbi:MAG TPA: SigE family RNA polymerase sigma factor [Jatrophihabitantaceae bacterium]|nr:SigE family RNA polymerase sigma factor [Jatrophihabitantaceae bacterium]
MRPGEDAAYCAYVVAHRPALRRTAFLLCGDWHLADDLVQVALTRLYVSWRRVQHAEAVDAYTRRVLTRVFLDERRRPWRRELVSDAPAVHERYEGGGLQESTVDRDRLLAALTAVPARQRAVLVLRFFDDLSVEQVAQILRCRPGTVKSQTARGLARLRAELGPVFLAGARRNP